MSINVGAVAPIYVDWRVGSAEMGSLSPSPQVEVYANNAIALQLALSGGGVVSIRTPGTYLFNSVVYVPSFTTLYLGAGVTLKAAPGAPSAILTNSNARNAATVVAAGNAIYELAPDGANYCCKCSSMTPAQLALFPVNSWVSIVTLGHGALGAAGTAAGGRGYRGVWKVIFNDGVSVLRYEIENVFPGGNSNSNALQLYQANQDIVVSGPGTVDGNGQNASQAYKDGDPRGNVMWWRHVNNLVVDGLAFRRGTTWTIGSNNVRNYTVKNCTPFLRTGTGYTSTDFVHLSGYHRDVRIEGNVGDSCDNFVGLTIDCTESTAYDFPYQAPGDMYGIKLLNNVGPCISALGSFGVIGIYGPAAYKYYDIEIDGLSGLGGSAVQVACYPPTNMLLTSIGKLTVKNCYAQIGGSSVGFTDSGVYDIQDMVVEDVSGLRPDVPSLRFSDTATGTIRSLRLNRLGLMPYDFVTFTRTVPLARFGGMNISALSVDGSESIVTATTIFAFAADGPGNLPKVGFSNCSISHPDGVTNRLWGDTGGGTAVAPVYFNCRNNGNVL